MEMVTVFERVLIANRGEIAVRIIKACQELGVHSVAIYSDVDAGAPHVQMADEAHPLGGTTPLESYLNVEKVLGIAVETRTQAIHPGYGFLSENADFAKAVEDAGMTFIGPPSGAISSMGSKIEAKTIMEKAGVPVIPGYHGEEQEIDQLVARASGVEYPLMPSATVRSFSNGTWRTRGTSRSRSSQTVTAEPSTFSSASAPSRGGIRRSSRRPHRSSSRTRRGPPWAKQR
jgi:3-methylcrotonyl-CoA carboxylase alpha subunit